jgi:hypothetical protein
MTQNLRSEHCLNFKLQVIAIGLQPRLHSRLTSQQGAPKNKDLRCCIKVSQLPRILGESELSFFHKTLISGKAMCGDCKITPLQNKLLLHLQDSKGFPFIRGHPIKSSWGVRMSWQPRNKVGSRVQCRIKGQGRHKAPSLWKRPVFLISVVQAFHACQNDPKCMYTIYFIEYICYNMM